MLAAPSYTASNCHRGSGHVQDVGGQAGELIMLLDQLSQARTVPTGLFAPGAMSGLSPGTSGRSCWVRDGSAPTGSVIQQCGPTPRPGPTGSGPSRAPTASGDRSRSDSSKTVNRLSTSRPSSPSGSGSSTPATTEIGR